MASKRRVKKRRRGWIVLLVILVVAGIFLYDQQNRIEPETLEVPSARLPAAFDGFRVVQVSDLHGKEFGTDNERLLEEVRALEPDIIALTGDLVDAVDQLDKLPALARGFADIAPTYFVTGNHEWAIHQAREVKAILEENGVTPLTNEYTLLTQGDASIVLAGIDDPNGPYDQKTAQELTEEIRAEQGDKYILLLAHRNETYETYSACGADLILCGHVHGGIIRLPGVGGLIGHIYEGAVLPEYTAGLYSLASGGVMMVSRGMGNNVPIPRMFNRPHLPMLVLRSG
ncbi:MAG: metallophosphoesterase [Oscillospiraceae bacterium]|nr:metallophosphoesterase [Oscillospiraceae bacterium]